MAVYFHDLPVERFPAETRPYIKRLNRQLRDLFGLEGTLKSSRSSSKRSDNTIARRYAQTVHVTRVEGLEDEGSPVSQLTQDQINILNGEADLIFAVGFGPVLSVVDDLGATRTYRLKLTWNASVTPKRPMLELTEVV